MRFVKFVNSLLFVSVLIKQLRYVVCVFKMYSDSSDSECFSYDDPYQPKELPAEYLSGIEILTCMMFNIDSPFYSALFSDQGEVAEVKEEISDVDDEENTSNNVGIPIDLEHTVDKFRSKLEVFM